MSDDSGCVSKARHRHGRSAQNGLEEAQIPRQVPSTGRRGQISRAVSRFRRGAPLSANGRTPGASQAEETRTKGSLELHAHDTQAQDSQPSGRSQNPADASRLHQYAATEGRFTLGDIQEEKMFHTQQPVLPTGCVQGTLPSEMQRSHPTGNLLGAGERRTPVPSTQVHNYHQGGDR
uniref:Uncharacterized protein n=1 Tax=Cacopsylla melanoneura TaxID=428564 RepID=A0A8D9BPF7_9HEMI